MWDTRRAASLGDWLGFTSKVCFAIFAVSTEKQWKRIVEWAWRGREIQSRGKGDELQSKDKAVSSMPSGYMGDVRTWNVFSGRLV